MSFCCLGVMVFFGSNHHVAAQLSVGPAGLAVQTFDSGPVVSQWSTLSCGPSVPSAVTTGAQLDAVVQTNSAASVNLMLPTSSTTPPVASLLAQWNSTGHYLQTRANGNWYTLLMAALRNDTASNIAFLNLTYDLATGAVAPTTNILEEIPGHRVYYSLTGATGTWVRIPGFDGANSGTRSATLPLGTWAPNASLFILWADDNGSGSTAGMNQEGGYTIDNFAAAAVPAQNAPIVLSQPQSQSATPGVPVTLSVDAAGANPLFYQWRKNSNDIAGATNQTYTIANPSIADTGFYSVIVSNSFGIAVSSNAFLDVNCPVVAPGIINQPSDQTLPRGSSINLTVGVSGTGPFNFQWYRDGAALLEATNSSYLKTNAQPSDSGGYFALAMNCAGSVTSRIAAVSVTNIPVLLLGLTNTFWRYDQSGSNYGTVWKEIDFDDSAWPSGRGILGRETDASVVLPLTNTVLSLTNQSGQAIITYYFRTRFLLTNDPVRVTLLSSNYIDDGAVFYLNGFEVLRINMPSGLITSGTGAQGAAVENVFIVTNFPSDKLVQGTNVLAVEVHQTGPGSSDIDFGMSLFMSEIPPGPPSIASQPASAAVFPGQDASLSVVLGKGGGVCQWFQNGLPVPSATNYSLALTGVQPRDAGNYFAIVSNSFGAVTSSVATLSVLTEQATLRLLEFTNLWRFNQSASNLGTAWRAPAFDDSNWAAGAGVFARTTATLPQPINTQLLLATPSGTVITTYYFRVHFALPPGASNVVLRATNVLDDGAVFHVNGSEAARLRLNGVVTATTLADLSPSGGTAYEPLFLLSSNVVPGDNVLAVEVHQNSNISSDVVFGMNLLACGGFNQGLRILSPPLSQAVAEGAPASVTASVFGGEPLSYQWFRNDVAMPGETNATVRLAAAHPSNAGNFFFIASNAVGAVTSSIATVSVIIDTAPPTVIAAFGTNGTDGVVVVFSEPVAAASATHLANYAISPAVTIYSAEWIAPDRVLLTTSGLDVQSDYALAVANILDQADAPNAIAPGSLVPIRPNRLSTATGLLQVQTVFLILFENQRWSQIKGSTNCPYLNSLLPQASYCDNYFGHNNAHPSEPNYLWLEAGDDFGFHDDFGPAQDRVASTNHLATQLRHAGIEWRGYMEDMPYGSVGITNAVPYFARHNPFAFFDDVTSDYDYCTNHVRPYAELAGDLAAGRIGRYNVIVPNYTNDMHTFAPGSASLAKQGDDWLARELPPILNSSVFSNNGAVFITWDENDFSPDTAIGMIVFSPLARGAGYASPVFYDHSSTLRTMQEIFGTRPFLGDAVNASPLNDLFAGLTVSVARTNSSVAISVSNLLPGRTTYVQASSNLVHWVTISTNLPAANFSVTDPSGSGPDRRFYRVIQAP